MSDMSDQEDNRFTLHGAHTLEEHLPKGVALYRRRFGVDQPVDALRAAGLSDWQIGNALWDAVAYNEPVKI